MPRFAISRHDCARGQHWDFFLEIGPVLKTWALPRPPEAGEEMTCDALPDHRLEYLDYEGPVSGDRGSVSRWDHGEYQVVSASEEQMIVDLCGERLQGRAILRAVPGEAGRWGLAFVGLARESANYRQS